MHGTIDSPVFTPEQTRLSDREGAGLDNVHLPIYESLPSGKSLGNIYRIFADRIELQCRFPFFRKTFVIRKSELISIDIYRPPVLRSSLWALKIDLADLNLHVGIKRRRGFFKQLRFTPQDPREFVTRAREILKIESAAG